MYNIKKNVLLGNLKFFSSSKVIFYYLKTGTKFHRQFFQNVGVNYFNFFFCLKVAVLVIFKNDCKWVIYWYSWKAL